jgi:hypothetical protein
MACAASCANGGTCARRRDRGGQPYAVDSDDVAKHYVDRSEAVRGAARTARLAMVLDPRAAREIRLKGDTMLEPDVY